jgi:hypothetical protein
MNHRQKWIWNAADLFLLLSASVIPYWPTIWGKQYLFDDVEFVFVNPNLALVKSFKDCLFFASQPSKPVANFMIALAYLWGHGTVTGQRVASVLVHGVVVLLLYANLRCLIRRLSLSVPRGFAVVVAVLFALAPIHSEALVIAQFRGEMLGALFALLGLFATQRLADSFPGERETVGWALLMFLSLGLAGFSKEVFAVTLPPLMVMFYFATEKRLPNWKLFLTVSLSIAAGAAFWGVLLYRRLQLDSQGPFSYTSNVGMGIIPVGAWLWLAARALVEGLFKAFSGVDLTTTRLVHRLGIGYGFSDGQVFSVLGGSLLGVIALWLWGDRWVRTWVSAFALGIGIYLCIENFNIGAEHYWYFAMTGILSVTFYGIWICLEKYTKHPKVFLGVLCVFYGGYFLSALEIRLFDLRTRIDYLRAELIHHPEAGANWVNLACVMLDANKTTEVVESLLQQARKRRANPSLLALAEFKLAHKKKDFTGMRDAIDRMKAVRTVSRQLSEAYLDYALFSLTIQECGEAMRALAGAEEIDPTNEIIKLAKRRVQSIEETRPQLCRRLNIYNR